jgi:hypothetical protein
MIMYKLCQPNLRNNALASSVIRIADGACIPFDPANSDMQQFKTQVLAGAELQDSEGQAMSQEEANQFIATLP